MKLIKITYHYNLNLPHGIHRLIKDYPIAQNFKNKKLEETEEWL